MQIGFKIKIIFIKATRLVSKKCLTICPVTLEDLIFHFLKLLWASYSITPLYAAILMHLTHAYDLFYFLSIQSNCKSLSFKVMLLRTWKYEHTIPATSGGIEYLKDRFLKDFLWKGANTMAKHLRERRFSVWRNCGSLPREDCI